MIYYAYMGIIHVLTEPFSDPLSIVFFPNGDLENASYTVINEQITWLMLKIDSRNCCLKMLIKTFVFS